MLQLAGSVALLVAVVGGAIVWAVKAGLSDRFDNRREHG
jgi:hypothetical protein